MRAFTSITATGAPAQATNNASLWLLCTQDGTPLFDPKDVVIKTLYVDGVALDPADYRNNSGSENGNAPSGSVSFVAGYAPSSAASVTWDGTAENYAYTLAPAILAQYANSPTLLTLLQAMNQWIDPAADIDLFYNNIWNIQTASGKGLDIWGRIVGAPRTIPLSDISDYFGFNEGNGSFFPFNNDPFYAGPVGAGLFALSDDAYRVYILTKAFANISNMSIPSMNALLNFMFAGRGSCYVAEGDTPLNIAYTFNFALEQWEESIMLQPQLLPRPAGVIVSVVVN